MSDQADRGELHRGKSTLIDVTVPNAARVADYVLGGRENFAVDREAGRAFSASAPIIERMPGKVRGFRRRVVSYLVEAGIRQFLDVGTGLVAPGNTHEDAQDLDPCCRVLYTESDPMMLFRAQARVRSAPGGLVSCVAGDIADVDAIIASAPPTLDLSRPVGLLLLSTLAHVPTTIAATRAVSSLLASVPSGSYIAIYHLASDLGPEMPAAIRQWNKTVPVPITLRSRTDMLDLVEGLDLIEPGVVPVNRWYPGPADTAETAETVPVHGVVARKR